MTERFPEVIPVFPLTGALLLPGSRLPLNIFEPRYIAMVEDAIAGEKVIGMIQPRSEQGHEPPLFDVGCLGQIVEVARDENGRYQIALGGLTRFRCVRELERTTPYRQVGVDYQPFAHDRAREHPPLGPLRGKLLRAIRSFLEHFDIEIDWDTVLEMDDDVLVAATAILAPFAPVEKQALLEAATIAARAELEIALLDFAVAEDGARPGRPN